jgi:hypothetical protein
MLSDLIPSQERHEENYNSVEDYSLFLDFLFEDCNKKKQIPVIYR